jgi:hypothetical protein
MSKGHNPQMAIMDLGHKDRLDLLALDAAGNLYVDGGADAKAFAKMTATSRTANPQSREIDILR